MSVHNTQRQPQKPNGALPPATSDDLELEALIGSYLNGEYHSAATAADPVRLEIVSLRYDDITAMHIAKRIAEEMQAIRLPASPAASAALGTQIAGRVLHHLTVDILSHTRTALDVPDGETLGQFAAMLVESFLARVRLGVLPCSVALPARWATADQQAFAALAERLWRYGDMAGLTHPEMDSRSVEEAIEVMATLYTAAHFSRIDASRIDALALGTAAATLQRRVHACLRRAS